LDLHLDLLLHLDGVDLWRSLVQRPEVFVDADIRLRTRIESFGAYGRPGDVLHRISRTRRRKQHGWRGWLRHRVRVGQSSAAARDNGNGGTVLGRGCWSGCVKVRGGGGRRYMPADLELRHGDLATARTDADISRDSPNLLV